MVSETFFIDDQDSQIEYSPGWETPASATEYRNTASVTTKRGASFTFRFVGTSFKVYGRLSKATSATDFGAFPNTTYAIDGGQPTPFFGVPSFERDLLYQMFYASPPLANTKHTLIGTCEDEGGRVILDYIAVELPVDSDLSVKSSPLPLSATTPFSSSTMSTFLASTANSRSLSPPSATEIPTALKSNPSSARVIAIVGCVLGASLFVSITLIFYLRRPRVGGVFCRQSPKDAVPRPCARISVDLLSASNRMDDILVCAESHKPPLPRYDNRDSAPLTHK